MPSEQIYFHKGAGYDARSALQQKGYLKTAKNINFRYDGKQELRDKVEAMNSISLAYADPGHTTVHPVHSIKRFRGRCLIGADTHIGDRAFSAGNFTSIGASFANAKWWFREYKDFLHGVNGTDGVLYDSSGNCYPSVIANPTTKPSVSAHADAGLPNGTYACYYTFHLTFPNGHTYETGFSPSSGDVACSLKKVSWTSVPVCPYVAYAGTEPTIVRKLYRGPGTGGSLADIYYVATISDNTTTVYVDNVSDAVLATQAASICDSYGPTPVYKFIEYHFGRLYGIAASYVNRLHWSEPAGGSDSATNEVIYPIATLSTSWDDIRVAGFDGYLDPQGLISWGNYLYIPLKHTWLYKDGHDPDTWTYRKTWAAHGIGAPWTIDKCKKPDGIIGVTSGEGAAPAIAVFNGHTSSPLSTPLLDYIMEQHLDITKIAYCRGKMIGFRYHLLYPSTSASGNEPDTHLAIDLRRYPEIRVAEWTLASAAACLDSYNQSNSFMFGCANGLVYYNKASASETITVDVETHELIGGPAELANITKKLTRLKYNLDTNSTNVTLEIYCDGTKMTWPDGTTSKSIQGSSDLVKTLEDLAVNFEGYYFRLRITGAVTTFVLYSPWDITVDVTL